MARTKGVLSQHGETDSAETKECRNIIATSRNRKGCNIRRTNQSPYNVSRLYPHEGLKGAQGLSQDPRPPATIALGIYRGLGCQQKPRHFCETVELLLGGADSFLGEPPPGPEQVEGVGGKRTLGSSRSRSGRWRNRKGVFLEARGWRKSLTCEKLLASVLSSSSFLYGHSC